MHVSSRPGLDPRFIVGRASAARRPFPLEGVDAIYVERARNALYHIVRAVIRSGEKILMPDCHGGGDVLAVRAAGASVRYYPIRRDLTPDLDAVERLCAEGARALVATHFLGWPQPIDDLVEITRRHDVVLVEDCAHALLSEKGGRPLGVFGDFAVFDLAETLPIPNGAVLVQNRVPLPWLEQVGLRPPAALSLARQTCELLGEWARNRADRAGALFGWLERFARTCLAAAGPAPEPFGDVGIDIGAVDVAMSRFSRWLLSRIDDAVVRRRRRENFLVLSERLRGSVDGLIERLDEGVCPLVFPLIVSDKRAAAAELAERGVAASELWSFGDPAASGARHDDALFLREHVLGLPIHQDVGPAQLEHVADSVMRLAGSWRRGRILSGMPEPAPGFGV